MKSRRLSTTVSMAFSVALACIAQTQEQGPFWKPALRDNTPVIRYTNDSGYYEVAYSTYNQEPSFRFFVQLLGNKGCRRCKTYSYDGLLYITPTRCAFITDQGRITIRHFECTSPPFNE